LEGFVELDGYQFKWEMGWIQLQIDGKIKIVNSISIHLFRSFNHMHPRIWDGSTFLIFNISTIKLSIIQVAIN
jgi:hypothetical protein